MHDAKVYIQSHTLIPRTYVYIKVISTKQSSKPMNQPTDEEMKETAVKLRFAIYAHMYTVYANAASMSVGWHEKIRFKKNEK